MPDEYTEWRALEARVTAWETGEGGPLTPEEDTRWTELMEGWPLALEQADTAEWLARSFPNVARERALELYLEVVEGVTQEAGATVPLWIGLARERFLDAA